ncbi:MAG: DMT family transporter [Ilumatobacter sp.]
MTSTMAARPTTPETIRCGRLGSCAVAVSAIGFGFSPFFASRAFAAGVDPVAASFARIALLSLALSPSARRLRQWPRTSWIVGVGGAISMLGFAGYFVALQRAPVAAATVVYYTYPAVVLAVSALWWKRRLRPREIGACLAILVGVAMCIAPASPAGGSLLALVPAVAAPIGWAIYLIVLSGPAAAMPTAPKMFAGSIGGVVALLPLAAIRTDFRFVPVTADAAESIALLTVCTLAIPASLVTWGAPRAGDRATAMIGSVEFIVAISAAWALMDGSIGTLQLIGIAVILGAAATGARSSARRPRRGSQPCATMRRWRTRP